MSTEGQEPFSFLVEMVVQITGRPGVFMAGMIESGVVCVGDGLQLIEDDRVIAEFECDGVEFADRIGPDKHSLPAIYSRDVDPSIVREGQRLTRS